MPAISMFSESNSIPYSNGAVSSAPSTSAENSLQKFSIFSAVRAINPTAEVECFNSSCKEVPEVECFNNSCKEVAVSSIVNCLKDETGQVEMPKFTGYENALEDGYENGRDDEVDESIAIETLLLLSGSNNNIDAGKGTIS